MDRRSGFSLIAVLWITAMLSVIAMGYASTARLKSLQAMNNVQQLEDLLIARSCLEAAEHEYKKYQKNKKLFRNKELMKQLKDTEIPVWFPRYEPFQVTVGEDVWNVTMVAEGGRYDVNSATPTLLEKVLVACGMEKNATLSESEDIGEQRDIVIDSILDWIDSDGNHRLHGAENKDYYETLEEPYYCKNAPMESIEELLLVKGVTPDLFYGAEGAPGLVDFLTVVGENRPLDINSASPGAFALASGLSSAAASAVVEYRQKAPITAFEDLDDTIEKAQVNKLKERFVVREPAYITFRAVKEGASPRYATVATFTRQVAALESDKKKKKE